MPLYNTNLWTGAVAVSPANTAQGLQLSGVFPGIGTVTNTIEMDAAFFGATVLADSNVHSVADAPEARDDCRRFLWGVLEQYHVAYTGGRNSSITDAQASAGLANSLPLNAGTTGTGKGKTTKMTVSKSSLSLIDEDTAKTTYTVVFNYAVGAPGGETLEVEDE
jgi:hypothetical protein